MTQASSPADAPRLRPKVRTILLGFWVTWLALAGLAIGAWLVYVSHAQVSGDFAWLIALIFTGAVVVLSTLRRVARGELSADLIASVAIVAAVLLDQPFAGLVIVVMQSGGEGIERYAYRRATASLEQLILRAPQWAYVRHGATLDRMAVDSVRPGDLLVVRTGDLVPVDGTITSGSAVLDEAAITGEPLPRTAGPGRNIQSGGVNVGPPFEMTALRASRESQYMRMVDLVREAQHKKPPIQRLADQYAVWLTPLVFGVAALAAVFGRSPTIGLAVLVVATPCPLIVAVPVAVVRGIDRAAERGMIAKSGGSLEELGRARVVFFDKTGTLTEGRPEVVRVVTAGEERAEEILALAAGVERYSAHPLASAFGRALKGRPTPVAADIQEFPGAGVSGTIEGRRIVVGSPELCLSIASRSLAPFLERLTTSGESRGRLAAIVLVDGNVRGAVLFEDPIRSGIRDLPSRLRKLGIREVGLLTGDNRENAAIVARELGIARFEAGLSADRKVEIVGDFRRRIGPTVMVGDGINDAAALATASVGVAMGAEGAGITAEAADIVLVSNDPSTVVDGIEIGQRMLRIARQGILFGLGASIVLMAIAGFGFIAPALGAGLQEVIDVTVIFNALRVR